VSVQRRLAAILSADAAGYSRLMGDDDVATVRTLSTCRSAVAEIIVAHGGRVVDAPGDNILAEFGSAVDAVKAAAAMQVKLGECNAGLPEPRRMAFRVGVNLGDVLVEEGRLYGDGVNVAARLEALAEAGGICVSGKVYDEVHRKLDLAFEDIGEQALHNIAAPVRAYRVRPGTQAPAAKEEALARPAKPSIIVLPFANMSGVAEQEFFADGLTEDVLTELSRFRDLFVISRNTSFKYKGQAIDVRKVASELGVQYVLEGSVRRAGNRVRVTVQLIDAESDRHLWAERYDRDLEDIFAIQDEMTKAIVAVLPGRVEAATRDRAARKPTHNMAAYECVVAGKVLHHRSNPQDNAEALRLVSRAVELDPKYAHAHAWKACILGQSWTYGWCDDIGATEKEIARELEVALALDDNDSDVHRILAALHLTRNEHDKAAYHQQRALSLNPNDDAPEPFSLRPLLEPPRARVLRRAPLRGGGRGGAAHRRADLPAPRFPRSLPGAARRCGRSREPPARGAEAKAAFPRRQALSAAAALQARGRPRARAREPAQGRLQGLSRARTSAMWLRRLYSSSA
jgi:adenylate cyclase